MNCDLFPADELILRAKSGDLDAAVELDRSGFLVQPGESAEEYANRVAETKKHGLDFYKRFDRNGSLEIFPGLKVNLKDQISREITEEAMERTREAYGICVRWVPGFFPEREFGPFWGGCAVWEEENPTPVIVIRKNFAGKQKWFIYDRTELISHELCHAARMPLMDQELEEHFAYGISRRTGLGAFGHRRGDRVDEGEEAEIRRSLGGGCGSRQGGRDTRSLPPRYERRYAPSRQRRRQGAARRRDEGAVGAAVRNRLGDERNAAGHGHDAVARIETRQRLFDGGVARAEDELDGFDADREHDLRKASGMAEIDLVGIGDIKSRWGVEVVIIML